jgi:hypothetical protein
VTEGESVFPTDKSLLKIVPGEPRRPAQVNDPHPALGHILAMLAITFDVRINIEA